MARPALGDDFEPGARVRVRTMMPPGHVRAPSYLRGKAGHIERAIRPFGNPEQLAYNLPTTPQMLYRVRFAMGDLWGPQSEHPEDTLDAEIYAHWLEREE